MKLCGERFIYRVSRESSQDGYLSNECGKSISCEGVGSIDAPHLISEPPHLTMELWS